MNSELVQSVSIQNLLNQRAAVEAMLAKGIDSIREAVALAKIANCGVPEFSVTYNGNEKRGLCESSKNRGAEHVLMECMKTVDAGAWRYLMQESGQITFMDSQARNEWHSKVHAREVPTLTYENIYATFEVLHGSRNDIFERGVLNCFRKLSWSYKTNLPFKFGKKLIMTRVFCVYGQNGNRYLSLQNSSTSDLDDLERVFHIFEKLPEPDCRAGWYQRISKHQRGTPMEAESNYFSVRWFMNGNAHVSFKKPELVEKMNQILVKHYPAALAHDVHV